MAHPMKSAAHKNDPKWMGSLNQFRETETAKSKDLSATLRNHERSPKVTAQAAYESKKGK